MTNIKTLRSVLIARFGARRYRITTSGEIHVHGIMPNTSQTGWYLYGYINNAETLARLGM